MSCMHHPNTQDAIYHLWTMNADEASNSGSLQCPLALAVSRPFAQLSLNDNLLGVGGGGGVCNYIIVYV